MDEDLPLSCDALPGLVTELAGGVVALRAAVRPTPHEGPSPTPEATRLTRALRTVRTEARAARVAARGTAERCRALRTALRGGDEA